MAGYPMNYSAAGKASRLWVEEVVIGLNLCPFARRELVNETIRFVVTGADTEDALLVALQEELELLTREDAVETTLLIHPQILGDFHDYNDFLAVTDGLLEALELDGILQIASFHPDYQFAGTETDAVENYTNRSPYPMLHLLREDSLEEAIARYPDTAAIPARNIERMEALGLTAMQSLLAACLIQDPSEDGPQGR